MQAVRRKPKNRANKIHLVFDEAKRRDFLTGFHKRKLQRQKEAKEKFEKDLKEERKRIKTEAKERYKKLVVSHRPIPELDQLLEDQYEDDKVQVRVVELSTSDIALQSHWIGVNQPTYNHEDAKILEAELKEKNKAAQEEIPGMELRPRKNVPTNVAKAKQTFNSKKDIKKTLKKQATKSVKKSKVFQKKNKLEQLKQKKKSLKQQHEQEKAQKKLNKHKKRRQ